MQKSNKSLFHKTILPDGLRIISETIPEMHSLAIGVWINVGSQHESEKENGISHFIEHTVFKGTQKRSIRQIAQYLESVGGYVNAFTTKENTCYYARIGEMHLRRAIELLSDIVLHPVFPEHEIEKEKQVIIEEMHSSEDEPEDIIHDYFERQVFAPHSLNQFIIGTEKSVQSISQSDIQRFHRKRYTKKNMLIVAAGAVNHDQIVKEVEFFFQEAPKGKIQEKFQRVPKNKSRQEILRRPIHQAHVCIGRIVPNALHPLRHSMAILNTLLGDGMSSHLFQTIRERYGYAYTIYSFLSLMKQIGLFGIYFGTDDKQIQPCLDLIYTELDKLRTHPISKRELNRAKEQIKGGLLLGLESTTNRMTHIARNELYYEKYFPVETILAKIDAVTIGDISKAASIVCDRDSFSSYIIAPEKT